MDIIYKKILTEDSKFPDLVTGSRPLSYFEFWPSWLFYFPMKIYAFFLALRYGGATLPTITNPLFDVGGFVCESKTQILNQVPKVISEHFCTNVMIEKTRSDDISLQNYLKQLTNLMTQNKIDFPCVIKPDIGARGLGVQIAHHDDDIKTYLANFPEGEKITLQQMADYPHEAGLFYIKHPHAKKGQIFSLTFKYFPYVIGDGVSCLKDLILKDPRASKIPHIYLPRHKDNWDYILPKGDKYRIAFAGSHSMGTIFKNANAFITQKMIDNWDQFCQKIPEFYFGRFDIRFNCLADLENINNIKIIEINGASAEATHIWDSGTGLIEAYTTLMKQYKYMYEIGSINKKRGFKPLPFGYVMSLVKQEKLFFKQYPLTH